MNIAILSSILIISSIILFILSLYGFTKKNTSGALFFSVLLIGMILHSMGYAFELVSKTIEQMYFWIRIEYIGISFLPLLILLFSSRATDERKICNNYTISFVALISIITLVLVNTNEYHFLYYKSLGVYRNLDYSLLKLVKGPWYYVHSITMLACNIYGVSVFIRKSRQVTLEYRRRALIMFLGASVPLCSYIIYFFGLGPEGVDILPFSYLLMSLLMGIGFFKYDLLFLTPITHEMIFNSIDEAVLVTDGNGNLISFNDIAKHNFESMEKIKIGDSVKEILELQNYDFSLEKSIHKVKDSIYEIKSILVEKIKVKIYVIKNITESEKIKEQLEILATTDMLTGLYNRRYFMDKFTEKCSEGVFSIIDIDHFKKINDKFGHSVGDKVLKYFGSELNIFFKEDMVCRYGGEEFAIFFEKQTLGEAFCKLEDFRIKIDKVSFEIPFTFSGGMAICKNGNTENSILLADKKLYEAKTGGRNLIRY